MKVNPYLNSKHLINPDSQKILEEAARLPEKLNDEMLKLKKKLVKTNIEEKVQSSQIDTYA